MSTQGRYEFRRVIAGVETLSERLSMPRHHHDEGYATVVLAGSVTEVSFAGRMHAEAGDVLLHGLVFFQQGSIHIMIFVRDDAGAISEVRELHKCNEVRMKRARASSG